MQAVLNILDCWGSQEVTFRTDQEPSVQALAGEVRSKRTHRTLIEVAPRTSPASVGGVERANQEMGKQVRALRLVLENRTGAIPESSHVWHWLVRRRLGAYPIYGARQRQDELPDLEGQTVHGRGGILR